MQGPVASGQPAKGDRPRREGRPGRAVARRALLVVPGVVPVRRHETAPGMRIEARGRGHRPAPPGFRGLTRRDAEAALEAIRAAQSGRPLRAPRRGG